MINEYKKVSKYVLDTSVIIERIASRLLKEKKIHGIMLIPNAVVAELEAQANRGLEIGFIGLDEIQRLREITRIKFVGSRPTESQIRYAKSGEIDAYIREIAVDEGATLITADLVQAESAKAYGIKVEYFKLREAKAVLKFESFFDNQTMSIHVKEGSFVYGKKGCPGNWDLVKIGDKKLNRKDVQDISKEIIEKSRIDPESFVEISRRGSTVIQYKNYRVVIVRPPIADGWEITIVRPLKKLNLEDYKLPADLLGRIKEKSRGILISGEPGSGKCHGKNTPILMHNGSIKMIQDVKRGDKVMGPDSKARKVLGITKGRGKLYKIIPVKGEHYVVNEEHILSLKFNNHYKEKTINISVKDFLNSSNHFKGRCKGYRTKIDFKRKKVLIDHYFLGLWLGDCISASPRIATADSEILEFLEEFAEKSKLKLKCHSKKKGICQTYGITTGKQGGIVINHLLEKMKTLNLINNKHVPIDYKINDRKTRLQILAGLLDTDGHLKNSVFEITTKFEVLRDDILFIARSLGFAAYSSYKIIKNKKYYRINLSGDFSLIPTKIKRKIGQKRQQVKNVLRTGITVKSINSGDFYGFELDGDKLYCLGDFTVTHNSTFAQALAEFYLKNHKIVKTVESPRDLQLDEEITQYSKNFASSEEIHDILFLSRPDNIIFDEMRDTPDFQLYTDLRLAGSECIGVVHSASPIDAVQRFISRIDVGVIPSVIDTVLFVSNGGISKILNLKMTVKVPTGMTESDLARPVIDVCDFSSGKLEYEIYSYGEQTVVIPMTEQAKSGINLLAEKAIVNEFRNYTDKVDVEVINNKAIVSVPERDISRIIGVKGKTITDIEKRLGVSIEIRELKKKKESIEHEIKEDNQVIKIFTEPGKDIDVYVGGDFLFSAISSKKGEIKVHKKSNFGRHILKALNSDIEIEVRA